MAQAADLHVLSGGDFVELADFDSVGQDKLDAPLRAGGGLAAQAVDGCKEAAVVGAAGFEFEKTQIGAALLFEARPNFLASGGEFRMNFPESPCLPLRGNRKRATPPTT